MRKKPSPLEELKKIKKMALNETNFSPCSIEEFDYYCECKKENEKIEKGCEVIKDSLQALEIIKEIAKSYDIGFCDNNQTMSFKIVLRNKFILETITIKDKTNYDLLKEVML